MCCSTKNCGSIIICLEPLLWNLLFNGFMKSNLHWKINMTSCTSRAIVKESLSLKLHFTKKKNEAHIYNVNLVKHFDRGWRLKLTQWFLNSCFKEMLNIIITALSNMCLFLLNVIIIDYDLFFLNCNDIYSFHHFLYINFSLNCRLTDYNNNKLL